MEIWWGRSKHTAVGPEHFPLHLDGEVAQPALLPLAVQVVQNSSTGRRETHLHSQTRWSRRDTASRIHGHIKLERRLIYEYNKEVE